MRRHLINVGAAGSVLLCVALVVLWIRSYRNGWHGDQFPADVAPGDRWQVRSEGGGLTLYELEFWYAGGVSTGGRIVPRYNSRQVFGLPYWLAIAATAPFPTWYGMRWKRRRDRVSGGLCLHCGYDLRASPTRCPECGAVPAAGVAT